MIESSVYWIRHPEHTNMFAEGYIGVSKNVNKRFNQHKKRPTNPHLKYAIKKYGWDNLIKEVILIADEAYCLMIETALRLNDGAGWNVVKGGGMPPRNGKGYPKGNIPWNSGTRKPKPPKKPRVAWNKGIKTPDEVKEKQSLAKVGKQSPRLGKQNSENHRLAISLGKKGKKLSAEVYKQQALKRLGYKHEIVTCPNCGKSGGITAMPRWHFNNCKEYNQ